MQLPVPPDPRNFQSVRDAFRGILSALNTIIAGWDDSSKTVKVRLNAGVPAFAAADGALVLDTTHNRLYVRSGGAWKYAALT